MKLTMILTLIVFKGPLTCMCNPDGDFGCYNMDVFENSLNNCEICSTQDECRYDLAAICMNAIDGYGFAEGFRVCMDCFNNAIDLATAPCSDSGIEGESIPTQSEGQRESPTPSLSPIPSKSPFLSNSSSGEETLDLDQSASSITAVPDCVETAWLINNGFSSGILEKQNRASVLCPPNLPCATEGHLIRYCDGKMVCKLVTYQNFCEEKKNCNSNFVPVSKLRNSFDWNLVNISHSNGKVFLTSLSVSEKHFALPWTRLIAWIAHILISHGFGWICDLIIQILTYTKNYHQNVFPILKESEPYFNKIFRETL